MHGSVSECGEPRPPKVLGYGARVNLTVRNSSQQTEAIFMDVPMCKLARRSMSAAGGITSVRDVAAPSSICVVSQGTTSLPEIDAGSHWVEPVPPTPLPMKRAGEMNPVESGLETHCRWRAENVWFM